jgi:hypothetical protein
VTPFNGSIPLHDRASSSLDPHQNLLGKSSNHKFGQVEILGARDPSSKTLTCWPSAERTSCAPAE